MHPTALHLYAKAAVVHNVQAVKENNQPWAHSLIIPVTLYHEDQPEKKTEVNDILDPQSDTSFVSRVQWSRCQTETHDYAG
jgi:hypothetical protein